MDVDHVGCSGDSVERVLFEPDTEKRSNPGVEDEPTTSLQHDVVVRALSGSSIFSLKDASADTCISELVKGVCAVTGARDDEVRLFGEGAEAVDHSATLESCSAPRNGTSLEFSFLHVPGPPVVAVACSGRAIEVLDHVPPVGGRCHIDRQFMFVELGGFAKPKMRYVRTSCIDKVTPAEQVMWRLDIRMAAVVHLNFRSQSQVSKPGVASWLDSGGWEQSGIEGSQTSQSSESSGPVYSKSVNGEVVELMGSNSWEGAYLVFVELIDCSNNPIE